MRVYSVQLKTAGGLFFGIAFLLMARKITKDAVKNYLVTCCLGMALLFAISQESSLTISPFPPFGVMTSSLAGLSAYTILIGIFATALSIAKDTTIRTQIKKDVTNSLKLLSDIGSSQLEQELIRKVEPMLEKAASTENDGVTSLEVEDAKAIVDEVLNLFTQLKNRTKNGFSY